MKTSTAEFKMTMSVYIISPDLGKHKIAHFFFVVVGLSLPTPCALYSLLMFCIYGTHTDVQHIVVFYHNHLHWKLFYSERVGSDRLMVDMGSLDVSLDQLLAA